MFLLFIQYRDSSPTWTEGVFSLCFYNRNKTPSWCPHDCLLIHHLRLPLLIQSNSFIPSAYSSFLLTSTITCPSSCSNFQYLFHNTPQNFRLSPSTGTLLAKKENSPLSKRFPSSSVTRMSNTRICFPVFSFMHSQ